MTLVRVIAYNRGKKIIEEVNMFVDNSRNGELFYQLDIPFEQGATIFISNAIIQNVNRVRGDLFVTAVYDGIGSTGGREQIVFIVGASTVVQDQNGRKRNPNELRPGMSVNALVSSRMTRSIPPQTNAFIIIINNQRPQNLVMTGRIQSWNPRINTIIVVDRANIMRFFIGNRTAVIDNQGRRIQMSQLRQGDQVRVEYQQLPNGRNGTVNMAISIQRR